MVVGGGDVVDAVRSMASRARRTVKLSAWNDVLRADPCSYCGRPSESVDHVVPKSQGGGRIHNLAGSCRACNGIKATMSLLQFLVNGGPSLATDEDAQKARDGEPYLRLYRRAWMRSDCVLRVLERSPSAAGPRMPGVKHSTLCMATGLDGHAVSGQLGRLRTAGTAVRTARKRWRLRSWPTLEENRLDE